MAVSRFSWNLWKSHFPNYESAVAWYGAVPDLVVAIDWLRMGIRDPIRAKELTSKGYSPSSIRQWLAMGYHDMDVVYRWLMLGQTPQSVKKWGDAGFTSFEDVRLWASHGMAPDDVRIWFDRGLRSPYHIKSFKSAGVTPEVSRGMILAACAPESFRPWLELRTRDRANNHLLVNSWILNGADVAEAAPWVHVGASFAHAELLRAQEITPTLLERLSASDCRPLVDLVVTSTVTKGDLEQWSESHLTLSEMLPWVGTRISLAEVVKWRMQSILQSRALRLAKLGFTALDHEQHDAVRRLTDKQMGEWEHEEGLRGLAPIWVKAGVLDGGVATKWMKQFGVSPEQVVERYRSSGGDLSRAKRQERLEKLVTPIAGIPTSHASVPLEASPGRDTLKPKKETTELLMRALPYVSDEWLEEVIARARITKPNIRKVPNWPAQVDLLADGVSIELQPIASNVKGVVTRDQHRLWCLFDPETIEILSPCETSTARYVAGVSISWFIDCSVVIPGTRSSDPSLFASSQVVSRKGPNRIRYMPTATFTERRSESRSVTSRLVVRHLVSGHKRTLPPGHFGSQRARANAPRHMKMAPNETFVESHFRGSEEDRRKLQMRLSRYSALGDALAEID